MVVTQRYNIMKKRKKKGPARTAVEIAQDTIQVSMTPRQNPRRRDIRLEKKELKPGWEPRTKKRKMLIESKGN